MLGVLATEFKVTVSTATGTQAVYYVCNIFLFFFFSFNLASCAVSNPPPRASSARSSYFSSEHLPPLPFTNCPLAPLPAPAFLPSPPEPAAGGAVHRVPLIHRVRSSSEPSVCFQLPQTQEEAAAL